MAAICGFGLGFSIVQWRQGRSKFLVVTDFSEKKNQYPNQTMKYQFPRLNGLAVLMTSLLSAASLSAATLTFQTFAPTPGANDIYNFAGASHDGANVNNGSTYADGAGNDAFTYIAGDRTDQGQTFTTGSDPQGYRVNAVWLRHCGYTNNADLTWYRMDASAVMTVRITDPAQAGTTGFALDAENYT